MGPRADSFLSNCKTGTTSCEHGKCRGAVHEACAAGLRRRPLQAASAGGLRRRPLQAATAGGLCRRPLQGACARGPCRGLAQGACARGPAQGACARGPVQGPCAGAHSKGTGLSGSRLLECSEATLYKFAVAVATPLPSERIIRYHSDLRLAARGQRARGTGTPMVTKDSTSACAARVLHVSHENHNKILARCCQCGETVDTHHTGIAGQPCDSILATK